MSCAPNRVVRTRYAVRASDPASVRLPEFYAEELRHAERQAEAARRRRQAYVERVAAECASVAEVPLVESDGATKTLDFARAYLLRDDAVLNVKRRGVPFLTKLILHKETELLELLLDDPRVDVNAASADEGGCTVLMDACVDENVEAVRLLLRRDDLDVNARDEEGRTALYEAAWQGNIDIVRMLLAGGRANVRARAGQHGWTVVDAALTSCLETPVEGREGQERFQEFLAVVRLLVRDYGVDFQPQKMAALLKRKDERLRVHTL